MGASGISIDSLGHLLNTSNEGGSSITPQPKATRFNEDRRLEEVSRMLQFSDPVTISAGDRTLLVTFLLLFLQTREALTRTFPSSVD